MTTTVEGISGYRPTAAKSTGSLALGGSGAEGIPSDMRRFLILTPCAMSINGRGSKATPR